MRLIWEATAVQLVPSLRVDSLGRQLKKYAAGLVCLQSLRREAVWNLAICRNESYEKAILAWQFLRWLCASERLRRITQTVWT